MGKVRFATIGSSGICEQFITALSDVEGAELVGCCSRDASRAREFADAHGAELSFGGVAELCASDAVDAVYIASPNSAHAAQALVAISCGKHVLVEKSFSANEREAEEVFRAAEQTGVVAMEAVRNLHVSTFGQIEREVAALGRVRLAELSFSKVTSRVAKLRAGERVNIFDPRMAAGALMDIGVYCVAPAVALFGEPDSVQAVGVTVDAPGCDAADECSKIDLSGVLALGYADKAVSLAYGKVSDGKVSCEVQGERATLVWDQVSCPENLRVYDHEDKGQLFRMESGTCRRIDARPPAHDMACEISDFVEGVRGRKDLARWRDVTLGTLRVMDEARRQLGVVFPADLR